MQYGKYVLQVEENCILVVLIVLNCGIIIDCNGVIFVKNYLVYMFEIMLLKFDDMFDNMIDKLFEIILIDVCDCCCFKKLQEDLKNFESLLICMWFIDVEVVCFIVQCFCFFGVDVCVWLFCQYLFGMMVVYVIGYIGWILKCDQDCIDVMSDDNDSDQEYYDLCCDVNNYKGIDYIGKIGVEQSYEIELYGLIGFEEVEVMVGGWLVCMLLCMQVMFGNNFVLLFDIGLQQVVEQVFVGKCGVFVVIELKMGDVFVFVLLLSFDLNLFVDGIDQQIWDELNNLFDKLFLNCLLYGIYLFGLIYKLFMVFVGLMFGKCMLGWGFQDLGYFMFGGYMFCNDVCLGQGWVDMNKVIMVLNDIYFYMFVCDFGVNVIVNFMKLFGFGQIIGIDIQGEVCGILLLIDWKKKVFKKVVQQKWFDGEMISFGIGQGYNLFMILQFVYVIVMFVNNGVVMKFYFVKEVEDLILCVCYLIVLKESEVILFKQVDIDVVKCGMENVIENLFGIVYKVFCGVLYFVVGKIGIVQVFLLQGLNYKGYLFVEYLCDYVLFIVYVLVDYLQIVVVLVVENGGWGVQVVGLIVCCVFDYYLVECQNLKNEVVVVVVVVLVIELVSVLVVGDIFKLVMIVVGFIVLLQLVVLLVVSVVEVVFVVLGVLGVSVMVLVDMSVVVLMVVSLLLIWCLYWLCWFVSDVQLVVVMLWDDNYCVMVFVKVVDVGIVY